MKNMLLILLALIVMPVAVPVWAGDAAIAPSTPKPSAQTMRAAPDTQTSVVIELKGSPKSTSALLANLEKDAVYKEAVCSTTKKSEKTAEIKCAKADSGLMAFLSKNAQAVHWSISEEPGCPTGCSLMHCPPPNGPIVCCNQTTYIPC